jgi:pimeloyl-ACP methyl ester carboxylesterase
MRVALAGSVSECYTGSGTGHVSAARPGDTAEVTRLTLVAIGGLPAPVRWSLLATALLLGSSASMAWAASARATDASADYSATGPYQVETREISVPRSGADVPFDARLFIPVPTEAEPARDKRSALFAFGHGYLSPIEPYESTLRHLASWGITVVAPRSGSELFPSHERFATDLLAALDAVATAAAKDDWPGLSVDPEARTVGGHSMGGGAAILAAEIDPTVRTVATLTAAETRPSAVEAAKEVEVPVLLMAGSDDRIAPVERHQRPIFEAVGGPAQLRIIEGGGHCGFLDQADAIDLVCGRSTLDAEIQRTYVQALLTAWIRGAVMDDAAAASRVSREDPTGMASVELRGVEPS